MRNHRLKPGMQGNAFRPTPTGFSLCNATSAGVAGVISLLAATFPTGCASISSGPPTPAVTVPTSWEQAGDTSHKAEPHDLSHWWQQFDDAKLSGLITRALAANHDLRSARSRLREVRARHSLAKTGLYPTANAAVSGSAQKSTGEDADGTTHTLYSAGFDASWEPDIFGSAASAVRAAQADLAASEADLHATQVSLVAEVALNYVELRSSQDRLAIASANLARQSETLELTRWRAVAGLTTELDVEQSRSNVEQTHAQIPKLETGVSEAQHRLAILVGEPPTELREMLDAAGPIPSVPESVAVGVPADALRQRPDVAAAEQRLLAATARLDAADAERYPSLKLSGTLSLQGLTLGGLTGGDTVVRSLLGGLTAPIFNRSRIERNIGIQTESEQQALINYEAVILNALEEVENALVQLANAKRTHTSLTAAVRSARTAATLARDSYTAGLTSYQTVLDTERSVLSLEDSLTTSEADGAMALIRLYKALGGGWSENSSDEKTQPWRVGS